MYLVKTKTINEELHKEANISLIVKSTYRHIIVLVETVQFTQ